MEKPRTLDDITRQYDVVAIGVIVTMHAEAQGAELDLETLTARAEERLKEMPGGTEWYEAEWREELVKAIADRIAEVQSHATRKTERLVRAGRAARSRSLGLDPQAYHMRGGIPFLVYKSHTSHLGHRNTTADIADKHTDQDLAIDTSYANRVPCQRLRGSAGAITSGPTGGSRTPDWTSLPACSHWCTLGRPTRTAGT